MFDVFQDLEALVLVSDSDENLDKGEGKDRACLIGLAVLEPGQVEEEELIDRVAVGPIRPLLMDVVDDLEGRGTFLLSYDEEEGVSEEACRGSVGELEVFDSRPTESFLVESDVGNVSVGFREVGPRSSDVDSKGIEEGHEPTAVLMA